ncbi:MAG: VacJ family lipoprotein [Methylobacter sp.]|uniref:MlaA family lipoprotein n=1 Tax=Methylobacter sp. TaxID=2051955 RepID=UPI00258C6EEC|nr:VacJ family lipoprotein [Methylobacter sp.]MCL7419513.1 VacJ family lipoprotein [Methylobacter sp.]
MNKPNGNRNGKIKQTLSGMLIGVAVTLSGCASTGGVEQQVEMSPVDPYEGFNRKMYAFNDTVDDYVAKPISDAYKFITPQFVQTGVFNFFNNLKNINVALNDVLQAKFQQSAEDSGRFLINSTVGLAGLFDVARQFGLEQNEEDFEQTLAVWGVPQGSYLVLPFLGPSTARGIPGSIFDTAANPVTYVGAPVQLVAMLNARANAEGALKFIDEAALDPYVFTRESFLQWRKSLALDGKIDPSDDLFEMDEDLLLEESENEASDQEAAISGDMAAEQDEAGNTTNPRAFNLSLSADTKEFEQVSDSFSSTAQSFDSTARSFEEASNKIDRLTIK